MKTPAVGKKAIVTCHVIFVKSYNCSYRSESCFSPVFPSCWVRLWWSFFHSNVHYRRHCNSLLFSEWYHHLWLASSRWDWEEKNRGILWTGLWLPRELQCQLYTPPLQDTSEPMFWIRPWHSGHGNHGTDNGKWQNRVKNNQNGRKR